MADIPDKLKHDAIAEAIFEIRFDCDESRQFPEIVVGKLAQFELWKSFKMVRLPVSDIPAPVRMQDPNLKYHPVIELREQGGPRLVKIGVNMFAYHLKAPYPGWSAYKPDIESAVDFVFGAFNRFRSTRLGFRYVNIFNEEKHGVRSVKDLNFSISLAGAPLVAPQNLNYTSECDDTHIVTVRIASPEFVQGPPGRMLTALADIDVHSTNNAKLADVAAAKKWVEDAHTYEKIEFFKLFTGEMMERLVEK